MGFNAMSDELKRTCNERDIMLIEDCCESHGAEYKGRKIGSYGDMACYSFYYGHHITTVEGGMVCTNDHEIYQMLRMFRSHGLVRECTDIDMKESYYEINPEPSPEFVFAYPGFNFRGTEIGAVLGIRQMAHIDSHIKIRKRNFELFLDQLDSSKYKTDFSMDGNSNFGLVIVLTEKNEKMMEKIIDTLNEHKIANRRGVAGGGNQLRQPYLKNYDFGSPEDFPNTEHIHYYSVYIGNHQNINEENIRDICNLLNSI
jgi:CDP-6-deoxy-D-xylo-4-hexulose-3-dehydrase